MNMQRHKKSFSVESLISHVDVNEKLDDQVITMPLSLNQEPALPSTFVENDAETTSGKDSSTYVTIGDLKERIDNEEPSPHQGMSITNQLNIPIVKHTKFVYTAFV